MTSSVTLTEEEATQLEAILNQIGLNFTAARKFASDLASGDVEDRSAAHTALESLTLVGAGLSDRACRMIGRSGFGFFSDELTALAWPSRKADETEATQ